MFSVHDVARYEFSSIIIRVGGDLEQWNILQLMAIELLKSVNVHLIVW